MRTSDLRDHAENRPGVYQMLGGGGQPIYVGRSIRVRTRLLSYFRAPAGDKATNLIRRCLIQRDYVYPKSTRDRDRNRVSKTVEEIFRSVDQGPVALRPRETAAILLAARWFELRPKELKRTATPKQWLETGAIGRRRATRSVAASRGAPA